MTGGGTRAAAAQRPVLVDTGRSLVAASAAELRSLVAAALRTTLRVELDLERVQVFDTAGLGLLVGLHRHVRSSGGVLVCRNAPPDLQQALRRLGLHRLLVLERGPESGRPGVDRLPTQDAAAGR